jgi:UDP-galactopyranose mutase
MVEHHGGGGWGCSFHFSYFKPRVVFLLYFSVCSLRRPICSTSRRCFHKGFIIAHPRYDKIVVVSGIHVGSTWLWERWLWINIRPTIQLGQGTNCVFKPKCSVKVWPLTGRNVVIFHSTTADVCQYVRKYTKFMRAKDNQLATVSGHGFFNGILTNPWPCLLCDTLIQWNAARGREASTGCSMLP